MTKRLRAFALRHYPFLILAGLIFLVYLPALENKFGLHNDYQLPAIGQEVAWIHPETSMVVMLGRPLNAVLLNIHSFFLRDLSALGVSRAVALGLSLLIGFFIFRFLEERLRLDRLLALALTGSILLLPSAQLNILWATQLVPVIVPVLMSLAAYYFWERARVPFLNRTWAMKSFFSPSFLLASGILLGSLMVYPPAGLFFLFFTAAEILFLPETLALKLRRAILDLALVSGVTMAYFILIKFILLPILTKLYPQLELAIPPHKSFYVVLNAGGKRFQLRWLTQTSFGFLNMLFGMGFGARLMRAVGVAYAAAALVLGWRWARGVERDSIRRTLIDAFFQSGLVFALILLINSPVLVPADWRGGGYRIQFAYSAVILLLTFRVLTIWGNLLPRRYHVVGIGAVVLFGLSLLSGAKNVSAAIINAESELTYYEQRLSGLNLDEIKQIVFVQPFDHEIMTDKPLELEFRQMALNYGPQFGIIQQVLYKLGYWPKGIVFHQVQEGESKPENSALANRATLTLAEGHQIQLIQVGGLGDPLLVNGNPHETAVVDLNETVVGQRFPESVFHLLDANGFVSPDPLFGYVAVPSREVHFEFRTPRAIPDIEVWPCAKCERALPARAQVWVYVRDFEWKQLELELERVPTGSATGALVYRVKWPSASDRRLTKYVRLVFPDGITYGTDAFQINLR